MKPPSPQTVAAIVSEISAGHVRDDLKAHPFFECMNGLLHMKEFRDLLGAFALVSFGDGLATEEDITIFGLSLFVTGLRVGRTEAISLEEYV